MQSAPRGLLVWGWGLLLLFTLIRPSYAVMYCGAGEASEGQEQLCSIFEQVETGQGCSKFTDPVELDVCLSLQNLLRGGNCSSEFKEGQSSTLIVCEEIYRGLSGEDCDHFTKHLTDTLSKGVESNKYSVQVSLGALCELGNQIPKNRIVFREIRKNALLMRAIEPTLQHLFHNLPATQSKPEMQEILNLASHILKRLDELKIGDAKEFIFLNSHVKNSEWLSFFKNLIEVIDKFSEEWIAQASAINKPLRFDAGGQYKEETIPAGVIVFPEGRIVVFFDRLLVSKHKDRPLKPIGEGGFKRVYLAFDYKLATKTLSDGFNDDATLVGGYIKSKKFDVNAKVEDVDADLIRDVKKEFEAKRRWRGKEGIAQSGDLIDLHGEIQIKEKLILLEPYYPFNLAKFRLFLADPLLESVNGKTKESVILKLAKNLITGLSLLHSNKIIHRDIKPENVLVNTDINGSYQGYLSDFGLTLDLEDQNNPAWKEKVAGTLEYMAPETVRVLGQTGEQVKLANQNLKNDVWAMGLTLYFLDQGYLYLPPIPPHGPNPMAEIKTYEDLKKVYKIKFGSRAPVSSSLLHVVHKMLNPNPEKRISAQDALKLINEMPVPKNWATFPDLLKDIKLVRSFSKKKTPIVFEKTWLHELHSIDEDSKKRYKKELNKLSHQ